MEFVCSVWPSVCGWKAVLNLLSLPSFFVVSFHRSEVIIEPRFVILSRCSSWSLNISLMKGSWNRRASMSFVDGMN